MLAASHEGEHFLSWATEDFTQGVGQQSYTPVTSKEPEDFRKLGSTQNNIWDTKESVQ